MLHFRLDFNPFSFSVGIRIPAPMSWSEKSEHYLNKHAFGRFTEHKSWEAESFFCFLRSIFEFDFRLSFSGEDHAGLHTYIEVLGLYGGLNIYDGRHWNYEEERWYEPGEQEKEWDGEQKEREYAVLKKEALPLLQSIRDSFLHVEDGPNYTEYVGVDTEADMHFFEDICKFVNKYRDLADEKNETAPLQTISPPPPAVLPPTV